MQRAIQFLAENHMEPKKTGLMRRKILILPQHNLPDHLVPTDKSSMHDLGLCPLFDKSEELSIDPEILADMKLAYHQQGLSDADIKQQLAGLYAESGPQCHVFQQEHFLPSGEFEAAGFKTQPVAIDAPCVVPAGVRGGLNCTLIQLRSLDQFELAKKTSLSPALCAGHSLNNACLIRDYAESGEIKFLQYLHDMNSATNFLLDLTINDWINVEVVKENLKKMGQDFNIDVSNIAAVSSVELFDSSLENAPWFALFNPAEFAYVQRLKQHMRDGLQRDDFVQVIIVGNEEVAESHGHYFAVALIKVKNELQCVVLDTLPKVYHLQKGSHERDRLLFLLDNIITGKSDIVLSNLRRYMLQQHGAFEQQP
jgi:hypothetical protein